MVEPRVGRLRAASPLITSPIITLADVEAAAERLRGKVHRTPMQYSRTFSRATGSQIFLKLENLQRTGSYKIRGALNRLLTLDAEQQRRGVVAASSGNHAQGVALAAATVGVPATIVMPTSAPMAKIAATEGYGAQIVLHGQYYDEAQAQAREIARQRHLTYIHGFDDPYTMAGQGTIALEMLEQQPDLEVIVVPIGGGGLMAGIATAARALRPSIRLVGVQPENHDVFFRLFYGLPGASSRPAATIADGVFVKEPGRLTSQVILQLVDEIVLVTEESIYETMVLLMERAKTVVEGAGALALAALLSGRLVAKESRIGVVISGGNVDLTQMDRVVQYGLASAGRNLALITAVEDRPGQLLRLTQLLAEQNVNIIEVAHRRRGVRLPINQVELQLTLETRDAAHGRRVVRALRAAGYPVRLMRSAEPTKH